MTFHEAANRLLACAVTIDDVAGEANVDPLALARAWRDPSSASYVPPPPNWREAIIRLARERATAMGELAHELEREILSQ